MKYDAYRYLWPPRPERAAPLDLLNFYQRRGWLAQVKKNGTCCVIFAKGDQVIFKNRHDEDHKAWSPQPVHREAFSGRDRWNVYVAELLHSKGTQLRHHLYLFDVLVSDGHELVGVPLTERLVILRERFPSPKADIIGSRAGLGARMISDNLSQAEAIDEPARLWPKLGPLDEGFVFKNPSAKLAPCIAETANGAWQVKIRRKHKNYQF